MSEATNRPLEFRAFHGPTQCLFPVLYFTEYEVFKTPHHAYYLDECVLMQFTGLYDEQGQKIFEGDVLHSYYPAHGVEPSREYWRVVIYQSGGFCEATSIAINAENVETTALIDYASAQANERLPQRIVDCYHVRPYLLELNTESAIVPLSFD